mgnify:CR=1 FL=1
MTDDVATRVLAERLQSWSRTMVLGRDTFTSLTRMAEAMDAVATRLLELLPADGDDEAVTAGRVAKLGVVLDNRSGGDYQFADLRTNWSVMGSVNGSHVSLSLMFREDGTLAACDMDATTYDDDDCEDAVDTEFTMPPPKTMGEFRRLCAALGIDLTEPK